MPVGTTESGYYDHNRCKTHNYEVSSTAILCRTGEEGKVLAHSVRSILKDEQEIDRAGDRPCRRFRQGLAETVAMQAECFKRQVSTVQKRFTSTDIEVMSITYDCHRRYAVKERSSILHL